MISQDVTFHEKKKEYYTVHNKFIIPLTASGKYCALATQLGFRFDFEILLASRVLTLC
jgi:hypothetical protein